MTDPTEPCRPSPRSWVERDRSLARAMHRATQHPALVLVLVAASRAGDGGLWVATLLALPWIGGPSGTACALRMLLLGAINLLIYRITKRHFARRRPFIACPGIRACTRCPDEYSFPSGHAMHAVAFATLLGAYLPWLGWLLWPLALLIATSRVVLGLHFPSDVAAGAALGWFMAKSVLVLF